MPRSTTLRATKPQFGKMPRVFVPIGAIGELRRVEFSTTTRLPATLTIHWLAVFHEDDGGTQTIGTWDQDGVDPEHVEML